MAISNEILEKFTLEGFLPPFWKGSLVYHECLCPVEQADGSVRCGNLLYQPEEILSVRSHDLQTVYAEGRDYRFDGRSLVLPEGSAIPVCPAETYAPHYKEGEKPDVFVTNFDPSRHLVLDNLYELKYSLSVTYTHRDPWTGLVPQVQRDRLPNFIRKLENREPVKIVYWGDSITVGWEASGLDDQVLLIETGEEFHANRTEAPYCPSWAKLVSSGLAAAYGPQVTHCNRAASCSTTEWGLAHAQDKVVPQEPDLVVIAFGMNEPNTPRSEMKDHLEKILAAISEKLPQTEYLLVSCMIPNPDSKAFSGQILDEEEKAMFDIQAEGKYRVAVAPVNTMCREMVRQGKLYPELTGNNFNHPGDMMHRIYAQTILAVLGEN